MADGYMMLKLMKRPVVLRSHFLHNRASSEHPSKMRTLSVTGQAARWTHFVYTVLNSRQSANVTDSSVLSRLGGSAMEGT